MTSDFVNATLYSYEELDSWGRKCSLHYASTFNMPIPKRGLMVVQSNQAATTGHVFGTGFADSNVLIGGIISASEVQPLYTKR